MECYDYMIDINLIETKYEYEFYNNTLICDNDKNCDIVCNEEYGCEYSEIYFVIIMDVDIQLQSGDNNNVNIFCYNSYSCLNMVIYSSETSILSIKCTTQCSDIIVVDI